jgi:hypothetical protein
MDWIKEIEYQDLLTKDAQLIYEHCGLETLMTMWEKLPAINLYLGQECLYELKRRYIRAKFDKDSYDFGVKSLAAKLKVSDSFVYDALAATDATDDRQERLL